MMRIAMLGHKSIPSRKGGVEIVVETLATGMAALGHEVTCYNRRCNSERGLTEHRGVRLKSVFAPDIRGLSAMISSMIACARAAFGKYDVVHIHAEGPCAMLWLPKLFGKRCIATVHGLDHQRAKWNRFASWYIRMGERCAVRYADEIIVLSENLQEYFMETYGRKTVYIPNGVDRPAHREADEIIRRFGLLANEYVLFLGRIVPEKGIQHLIEAFRGLDTDKKLVIAGGSSDTRAFEQRMRELAADDERILFTGFVEGRTLEELYSNAYLYVLPSDLEGMPLSLLEAMSYGRCCLTSDIPECADVIGECGVTFRQGDVAALRACLDTLCRTPEAVEGYRAHAADHVCSRYRWDDVLKKTLELYQ